MNESGKSRAEENGVEKGSVNTMTTIITSISETY